MKNAYSTAAPVAESGSRVSRILAPTDFSPLSMAAVDATVEMVMASPGTSATLLHVVEPTVERSGAYGYGVPQLHAPLPSTINHADRVMKDLRSRYSAVMHGHEAPLDTRIMAGAPARVICDMARDEGFDLIVMSSHGHMGLARMLIGSVAETVVQQAPCPVLVAKCFIRTDGGLASRTPSFRFTRLLVGYDHRSGARHALDMACDLGAQAGSHITLVHALQPAPDCPRSGVDAAAHEACLRKALDSLEEVRVRMLPDSHDWDLRVEMGEPWEVIV
jgi:nucleotide-binding universal stress UspA family protein